MGFKWFGPVALLATLLIGDQIRLNRPGHKYRLSIEVSTPDGVKSASGVLAVHPYRGYSASGNTQTKGDALFVDLGGGKNLLALLLHGENGTEGDGVNYLAMRAYRAAGRNVSFTNISQMTGTVPVTGALMPVLVTFTNLADPTTARVVRPDDLEAAFGKGFKLQGVSVAAVPNGFWPLDFGGPFGEPVTRGIEARLPWWDGTDAPAAAALQAAGLTAGAASNGKPLLDAREAFTRK